ncbi:MAG: aldehyde-activating protein [Moraxellaceae bacterium]|nr:MAG: aldehyde-activating protein [Moraxellaceae bacterium]
MIKGSCLCEAVQYEYKGSFDEVVMCHCNQCKKAQGTPFVTNAPIELANFKLTRGEGALKTFFSSPQKKRVFCGECGSPLYSQRTDMPETIRLRLGTVTEGDIPKPHYEIYCESKSDWFNERSNRQRYEKNK